MIRISLGPKSRLHQMSAAVALALGLLFFAAAATPEVPQDAAAPPQAPKAVIIRLEGMIGPMMQQFLERRLQRAEQDGVEVVILEIDSPGGRADTAFEMAYQVQDIRWARTVAYVPRQALSGAAVVALGCDEIDMAPTAVLGDVGVIMFDLSESAFRYTPEKQRSHLVRQMRDLAEFRGRSPSLVEAMMDKDLEVFEVRHRQTGKTQWMSQRDIDTSDDPDQWEKLRAVPESGNENFLEVNGARAVELGLAEAAIKSPDELFQRLNLAGRPPEHRLTAVDQTVYYLNSPWVTALLFIIGLVALFVEFSAPGIGMGAVIATLCFGIFFWSRFLGGTADWLDIVLFMLGLLFLGLEIFVIPGFGLPGLIGVLLILVSLVLASHRMGDLRSPGELESLGVSLLTVLGSLTVFCVIAAVMVKHFRFIPVLNRLALTPPGSSNLLEEDEDFGEPSTPIHRLLSDLRIGDRGTARSVLRPAGKARFSNRTYDVVSDGRYIEEGAPVEVWQIGGNRVVVRLVEDEENSSHESKTTT